MYNTSRGTDAKQKTNKKNKKIKKYGISFILFLQSFIGGDNNYN
jgi:hypothetical protein